MKAKLLQMFDELQFVVFGSRVSYGTRSSALQRSTRTTSDWSTHPGPTKV